MSAASRSRRLVRSGTFAQSCALPVRRPSGMSTWTRYLAVLPYPQLVGVALAHRAAEQDQDRLRWQRRGRARLVARVWCLPAATGLRLTLELSTDAWTLVALLLWCAVCVCTMPARPAQRLEPAAASSRSLVDCVGFTPAVLPRWSAPLLQAVLVGGRVPHLRPRWGRRLTHRPFLVS